MSNQYCVRCGEQLGFYDDMSTAGRYPEACQCDACSRFFCSDCLDDHIWQDHIEAAALSPKTFFSSEND